MAARMGRARYAAMVAQLVMAPHAMTHLLDSMAEGKGLNDEEEWKV